jgi:hypothetical protein
MKDLFENFRQYLDADDNEVMGLSYSEMVQELNKKMPRAKLALTSGPIQDLSYTQGESIKPAGLWYSCGTEWLKFVETELPEFQEGATMVFAIGYEPSKMLRVTSPDQAERVSYRYRDYDSRRVDWEKVSAKYAGIECCPYSSHKIPFQLYQTSAWYLAFDVPSGCIWDTSILTTKRLVAELKEDGWEVYK